MRSKRTIEKYLHYYVTRNFGAVVEYIDEWAPWLWRIQLIDGKLIAAKYQPLARRTRHTESDVLELERELLDFLVSKNCLVPFWMGCDKKTGFAFYEWVGDTTLDDYAQKDILSARKIIPRVVDSFKLIDNNINDMQGHLASKVIPGGEKSDLLSLWRVVTERAKWGAYALCNHLGLPSPTKKIITELDVICNDLALQDPRLGCSDFNARNIIIGDKESPYFIEFAKLNWDWTERRLVQYTTSIGSRKYRGNLRALLYKKNTRETLNIALVDAHQIVFMLNGAAEVCFAFEKEKKSFRKYFRPTYLRSLRRRLIVFANVLSEHFSSEAQLCEIRSTFSIEKKGVTIE